MIKVIDEFGPLLQRVEPSRVTAALGVELHHLAGAIANEAVFSIIDGAVSGRGHKPAPPGSPPNADTHDLDRSIHVGDLIETPGKVQTSVIADSEHAIYMELGTSKVLPRPFMVPAVERVRPQVGPTLRDAFKRLLRR